MEPSDHTPNCPLCGRPIAADQRTCACGAVVTPEKESGFRDYGMLLPWFGLAGFITTLWWIISPGMLYYTMMPVLKLYWCVAILSAVCAMLVAQKTEQDDNSINLSPANWFAFMVLLWPVALPLFLFVYYNRSDEKRMKFGWVTTGLFLCAILILWLVVRRAPTTWPGNLDNEQPPATTTVESNNNSNNNYAPPAPPAVTSMPSAPAPAQPAAPAPPGTPPAQSSSPAAVPPAPNNIAPPQNPADTSNNDSRDSSNSFGVALPPIP